MKKKYFKASLLMSAAVLSMLLIAGGAKAKDNSWGHIGDPVERFHALANFGGEAVLDRDTGLIWDQCPVAPGAFPYLNAAMDCYNKSTGGTKGWRLPTVAELMSLVVGNALPTGAPFCNYNPNNFQTGFFTATLYPPDPSKDYLVITPAGGDSAVANPINLPPGAIVPSVWCVRGGTNDSSGL